MYIKTNKHNIETVPVEIYQQTIYTRSTDYNAYGLGCNYYSLAANGKHLCTQSSQLFENTLAGFPLYSEKSTQELS